MKITIPKRKVSVQLGWVRSVYLQNQGDPSATPQILYFYATTMLHSHVADRANDSGSVDVALDGPVSGHQFG